MVKNDYLAASVKRAPAKSLDALLAGQPEPPAPVVTQSGEAAGGKLLLSPKEAAAVLSISERTLWTLSNDPETPPADRIPFVRIGRSVRYSIDDLRAWISRQKRCTGS